MDERRRSGRCYYLDDISLWVYGVGVTTATYHGLAMTRTNVNTSQDTKRQTYDAGGKIQYGLAQRQSVCLKRQLDKTVEKVDTLGLNIICLHTIVRVLLFIGAFVKVLLSS